jgi:hypothetical protein
MFVLTALVYPGVLAVLCTGAGLLVDRCCGRFLAASLLPAVGAATLIAVSQLTTYLAPLAPATPYLLAAVAVAGFAVARSRALTLARRLRVSSWRLCLPVLAYVIALAPVLFATRPSFSSYMALADSAVHMLGADFLIRRGADYAHLDLRNSYGQFVNAYYNNGYPSGADTLFGGSALLLRLPLIWAFQPFNAFMLATASGPAWLLARRTGLDSVWAALAALTAIVSALVYGYELLGSVKEIVAMSMTLTLGALVVGHRRWLSGPPRRAIPFALVLAGGVSALGVGFGAWGLASAAPLLAMAIVRAPARRRHARDRRRHARDVDWRARDVHGRAWHVLSLAVVAGIATLLAAGPTWTHVSRSVSVTKAIAATSNAGNLHVPLRLSQLFGSWLRGSYKQLPRGLDLQLTHVLVALTILACALGALHLLRTRRYALAAWLALMLAVLAAIGGSATTWVQAKSFVITAPPVMLLAWAGLAALRGSRPHERPSARLLPAVAITSAALISGGVLASDAMQYHASNLAPTARYEELASLNGRFAGRGPALFTDFDEWALYQLRGLDIGGPDFAYPPAAVAGLAGGYGNPVDLDLAPTSALLSYPLIITRRDPLLSRPPSVYTLVWQGAYYEVWKRTPGAAAAVSHVKLTGPPAAQCRQIRHEAAIAGGYFEGVKTRLLAAEAPEVVSVSLADSEHPARWGHQRQALVMSTSGRLSAKLRLPTAGLWHVWVQGQLMPTVTLAVDRQRLASIGGQLSGNSLVPNTVPPLAARLSAGEHSLTLIRAGTTFAPGDGGSAVLAAIFLTPAQGDGEHALKVEPAARWRSLCGRRYQWIELALG